jgi:hypothetical protein
VVGGGGACENDNETSISIKGGEFLDRLIDYQLLKKGFVPFMFSD